MTEPIAYVVDDDMDVLESIRWLLNSLRIPTRVFSCAREFLGHYRPGTPGCLILDVRMPGMSGLELQESLAAHAIVLPIIFISGHGDIAVAVRAMKHGALEFLQKPFDQDSLCEAVTRAFAVDRQQRERADPEVGLVAGLESLSPREREIMQLLICGASAKEVGKALSISPRTVEYHRTNILIKTKSNSLVALAAALSRRGERGL